MARPTPAEFMRQVSAEMRRVTWPTGKETIQTAIMVVIMASLLGLFFFALDSGFRWIVSSLLSLV